MGLKFRRGTNAQKSGSLAFGEPYVNTDLGTLQIGGLTGDITLGASGTGSQGSFAGISGSSLDITGNAKIDGNLILGGTITIGDASTDNVVVNADLSSSIIPNDDNAFDLGSTSKRYRAIYGTNIYGAINATNGVISGSSQLNTLATTGSNTFKGNQTIIGSGAGFAAYISTSVNDATLGLDTTANVNAMYFLKATEKNFEVSFDTTNANGIFRLLPYDNNSFIQIGNPSNSGNSNTDYVFVAESTYGNVLLGPGIGNATSYLGGSTPLTDKVQIAGNLYVSGAIKANSFTGSIAATNGVVSGSSQVTLSSTTGYSDFSSSLNSRILTEKGRVDAILSAADADKDSFAEIVTLINSVDTTNDSAFASFYTASVGRLNNLESTSGSVNISVSNLNTFSGSALTRLSALEVETANLETFSSSALTRLTNLEGTDIGITLTGDVTGTGTITNLGNVSFATTIAANSVALGTDTTGDYVASLVAGTNITLSNNSGESATPTIGLTNNAITIAGQSTALGSSVTAETIRTAIGAVVTGSAQIVGSSITTNTITIGSTSTALGGTSTTLAGLTSVTSTGFTGALTGNASTATTLQTARTINGTSFNGSADITIANLVSGSAQINVASTTGDIALGTRTSGNYVATITGGTGVSSTGATTGEGIAHTISIGQAVATSDNVRFNSLGIGGAASGTAGRIDAWGDIVAFSTSDKNFKENITPIPNALEKISRISGNTYDWKVDMKEFHGFEGNDVGVIAQEIEEVLPQLVTTRENGYKAVKYDKLVALLIEGIKEQQQQIHSLTIEVEELKKQKGL